MHSAANLPPLAILKKNQFFFQKLIYFLKKTKLSVLKSPYISVAFYAKFAAIWWKKISGSETWTNIVNAIGSHRLKKAPIWVDDFAPTLYNMAQLNNKYAPDIAKIWFWDDNWFIDLLILFCPITVFHRRTLHEILVDFSCYQTLFERVQII